MSTLASNTDILNIKKILHRGMHKKVQIKFNKVICWVEISMHALKYLSMLSTKFIFLSWNFDHQQENVQQV